MIRILPGAVLLILSLSRHCLAATPVQVSLVQPKRHQVAIPCTSLSNNDRTGRNPRGLNTKTPFYRHIRVQAPCVHEEDNEKEEGLTVMFWNVENFFDWRNDSTTVSDLEFSPAGERHWTWKQFQAKANAFAKALFWVEGETGRLPEIIGLEEVENAFVLRQVLQKTALRKTDYKYVHYDSPDRRGIDVALLYRSSLLELLDSKPCHLYAADTVMATRDILLCVFRRKPPGTKSAYPVSPSANTRASSDIPGEISSDIPGEISSVIPGKISSVIPGLTGNLPLDERKMADQVGHNGRITADQEEGAWFDPYERDIRFAVLVNHHPSKYGGAAESEPRRRIAVERLRFLADSLAAIGIDRIIAGGDFNDTPDNPAFRLLEPALMPTHIDLHRRGQGTIKYDGKWDLIDHIYVSPGWRIMPPAGPEPTSGHPESAVPSSSLTPRMRILRIPFLLTRDNVHSGEKPLRTYTGPRHTGGVSDHLPVMVDCFLPENTKGNILPVDPP